MRKLEAKFTTQIMPAGQEYEGLEPIAQGLLSQLSKGIAETVENSLWQGVSGGASAYTSLNLFDGINKIVDDAVTATSIPASQVFTTGALNVSNIIGSVEALYDALPADAYDGIDEESDWVVLMSKPNRKLYERAYRDTYGANTANGSFEKRFVDGTQIELVGVGGLSGNDRLLLIRKSNLILAVDMDGEDQDLKVYMDQDDENVRVKARFAFGVAINFPSEVVVDN
jgi:hypothetical protein